MLQELAIHNFAIIEQLEMAFENGMTVLSGETGAGKSIIIDAVGLLAGGRGSSDFIRTGAKKATLEGLFVVPSENRVWTILEKYGIDHEDDTILLQRDLYQSGRNICRVNGRMVNTATLREIGESLVDIHGQNEHQELMHPEKHLGLLDQFAGQSVAKIRSQYDKLYAEYQRVQKNVQKKQQNEQEWAQRLDMLRYQSSEIEAAQLQPHEEAQLSEERDRLSNYQKIAEALQESYSALAGDENQALDQIAVAMNNMQGIADFAPEYKEIATNIANAYYALQDSGSDLSHQLDGLEWDEGRLDEIEKRLEVLTELKRKYGDSVEDVIAYGAKVKQELGQMEATDESEDALEEQLQQLTKQLTQVGTQLTAARQKAAKRLEKAIHQQLTELYMGKTVFEVRFAKPTHPPHFYATGLDNVEFYVQTNPGERFLPLAKVASGGELSRMMLALKTIFSESQGVTSIIFDEVDTGVSGRVAQAIANKISLIAKNSQVLCITHLPQVAAMSDHQYWIEKKVQHKRTTTTVEKITGQKRVAALAKMLAGTAVTQLTTEHAEELLRMAQQTRKQIYTEHPSGE
ncbi:DNA repair protein RecN [Lactobacillus selangorensis]|uniref:DNA repair protein RecN n=1 Tax=Lactobacillus selangorensis TaxID=81857 RepID=A0A0R2FMA0_9LACO|nr:DNA repair protein RecN [Lactobacillus selangorensis]KRN29656.1 DNA repair protein RecN [Lactobacillus selangorensis]KRN33815.1 DNA repair protein RecN [Lactobacillus selangorensis]